MALVLGLLAGASAGWISWRALAPLWADPVLARRNYRDHELPVAGGLALVAAVIVVIAAFASARVAAGAGPPERAMVATAVVVVGFGLLGFLDDLLGGGGDRAFRGHLRAAARGRLTTGGLKLFVGGLLALLAAATAVPAGTAELLMDGLLIALAANTLNLFDLAPGRAAKFGLLWFVVLALMAGAPDVLTGPAVVMGAVVALLLPDLREEMMLGDTGANPMGAALGLGVVLVATPTMRLLVLALLLGLNLTSERVSFSSVIARVAPLRAFDRIGRKR